MKEETSMNRRDFVAKAATALAGITILPRYVLGGTRPDGTRYIAPSDMISLGFIGTGKQGKGLINSFLSTNESRIVAISEVYKAKAQLALERIKSNYEKNPQLGTYSEVPVYTDFRELLARKDVDAVVIATPDHWHATMAVRAAEAGKDIYCEKPLALTVKEGRAMVNAARKYNRVFQTGSMQRSWPEFRQAAELIRNGYIGEVKSIKVNVGPPPKPYDLPAEPIPEGLDWNAWLGPNSPVAFNSELAPPISKDVFPNWRNYREFGGGMVTDWGAHMFDIVQWALNMDDSGPVEVFAPDGKEHPFLTFRYENGITMTHEKWDWSNAILFTGTEGELRVQRKKIETTPASLATKIIGEAEKHVYKSENHYKDFFDAMRRRSKPICDVEIGHRTASVCNIGNIAYQLNRSLQWNPKKESFKNDKEANALLGRSMNDAWGIKI
ncbi:Gfo/Idh/MocA family protein [Runella slithyformis]|uniref:Oxidoreductase domain protein n=1 Tax=Runella slithyformis (strain ATCC 29530 / DSM 19594 / LMG 11500 / NCIMB 11436 / LSU 4) TaxID=761193 RepID=A0A7U4E7V4_RUNSL|nr:Gfo/Idh/MocA family oxidoreductase [Runella slithyformis]AEI50579.1 oxidoreductase domain protein [Runella slithyformis DSM 19594]